MWKGIVAGTAALRNAVERGGVRQLLEKWRAESRRFQSVTKKYWLYR